MFQGHSNVSSGLKSRGTFFATAVPVLLAFSGTHEWALAPPSKTHTVPIRDDMLTMRFRKDMGGENGAISS